MMTEALNRLCRAMYRSSRGSAMTVPALKTLIAKDRSRGTAYTRTLRVYLSENCSITKAAEHLNRGKQAGVAKW